VQAPRLLEFLNCQDVYIRAAVDCGKVDLALLAKSGNTGMSQNRTRMRPCPFDDVIIDTDSRARVPEVLEVKGLIAHLFFPGSGQEAKEKCVPNL
jgi:hypothetical protein